MLDTTPMKTLNFDDLKVQIFSNRKKMGYAAALTVKENIRALLKKQKEIRMIFAAAPSQNEFLEALSEEKDIDWSRIIAFHMDEYLRLTHDAPQGFGNYLKQRLFNRVTFQKIHYINPDPSDINAECARYASLLKEKPIDFVCLGIGENGHIAFNDPLVADFNDAEVVKVVELDDICRQQQVNDGCFTHIHDVPKRAITLTVPTLISAKSIFIIVPGPTKSNAVFRALNGPIETTCPASILRTHSHAMLYLDFDSASHLKGYY